MAIAFFVTAIMTAILEHMAPRFGMVDHPGGRKQHAKPIPLVGGISILSGFIAATAGANPTDWALAAMVLMVGIGVTDDIREISPKFKLLGQLIVALVLVMGSDVSIHSFGNLLGTGDLHPGQFGSFLTIFSLVGLANALNMIDGMDGLAGGLGLVSAIALAIAAQLAGQQDQFVMILLFSASIAGFLIFNVRLPWRSEARVFLGDSGSNLLGLTLAYFAVLLTQISQGGGDQSPPPICAVWLLGIPILDTLTVMARRIYQKRSPFSAGRDHLHHILQAMGFSHTIALWTVLSAACLLAAIGIGGWQFHAPDWLMLGFAVTIFIVYYTWSLGKIRQLNMVSQNNKMPGKS